MKHWLYLFFFLLPCLGFSQYAVEGRVIDGENKNSLAFVSVGIQGSTQGVTADIDGKFKLTSSSKIKALVFSYVGYLPLSLPLEDTASFPPLIVKMKRTPYQLNTVEIKARENPAHRIIRKEINDRDKNNPEKVASFS